MATEAASVSYFRQRQTSLFRLFLLPAPPQRYSIPYRPGTVPSIWQTHNHSSGRKMRLSFLLPFTPLLFFHGKRLAGVVVRQPFLNYSEPSRFRFISSRCGCSPHRLLVKGAHSCKHESHFRPTSCMALKNYIFSILIEAFLEGSSSTLRASLPPRLVFISPISFSSTNT